MHGRQGRNGRRGRQILGALCAITMVASGCGIIGGEDEPVAISVPPIVDTTAPPPTQASTTTEPTTTTTEPTTTTTTAPEELALADDVDESTTTTEAPKPTAPPAPEVTIDVKAVHEGAEKLSLPYVSKKAKTTVAQMTMSCGNDDFALSVMLVTGNEIEGVAQTFSFYGPSGVLYTLVGAAISGQPVIFNGNNGNVPAPGSYDRWTICNAGQWRVAADLADVTGPTVAGVATVVVSS